MIITDFYLAIMNRLMGANIGIEFFDWFNNQYLPDQEGNEYPFMRPAVFMEYLPMQWKSVGRRVQECDCEFNLHVVSEVIQEVGSREDTAIRNLGLAHFQLLDAIFATLEAYTDNATFGSISRTAVKPDHNHDVLQIHVMTFKCRLKDIAARPVLIAQSVQQDMQIIVETP